MMGCISLLDLRNGMTLTVRKFVIVCFFAAALLLIYYPSLAPRYPGGESIRAHAVSNNRSFTQSRLETNRLHFSPPNTTVATSNAASPGVLQQIPDRPSNDAIRDPKEVRTEEPRERSQTRTPSPWTIIHEPYKQAPGNGTTSRTILPNDDHKTVNGTDLNKTERNKIESTLSKIKEDKKTNQTTKAPSGKYFNGYASIEDSNQFMQLNCPRCAYVTSSGHLRGARAGHLIDEFPCVIRMNDAPTRSYEEDVGSKTTIRVIAFSSMSFVERNKDLLFKGPGKAQNMLYWGPEHSKDYQAKYSPLRIASHISQQMKNEGLKVFVMSEDKYDFAHRLYEKETGINTKRTNSWLSTGWFTMMFAREVCGEIHVFGMAPVNHCKKNPLSKVPYHYYQVSGIYECSEFKKGDRTNSGGHHLNVEKSVFARWSTVDPQIAFSYPDWPM